MQGVMTTDFYHTSLQSPCLAPDNKVSCWERCVKRKYNDGSGRRLEGYMAETDGGNGNMFCEASWGIMPRISNCHKTSFNSGMSSIASLQDEKVNKGCHLSLNDSNLGGFLHNPPLTLENEISCSGCSTDYPLQHSFAQSQYIHSVSENAVSKKRIHVAVSRETIHGSVHEKTTQDEIIRLKDALNFNKKALKKLYRDLKEERHASTTAANEAMAMIRRVQEQKAAAIVESHHYRLASEERETYNQEAIALLKEALLVKECELLSLQDRIETYRKMLLSMKSGQRMIQSNHSEGDGEREQLLLFGGKKTCLLMDSNQAMSQSLIETGTSNYQDSGVGNVGSADNLQCEDGRADTEIGISFQEQDLEDVSMSILVRVAHLEEQFACLRDNHALGSKSFDPDSHKMAADISELEVMKSSQQDSAPVIMGNVELKFLNSVQVKDGFVADSCDDITFPVFERVMTNFDYRNQERGFSAQIKELGLETDEMKSRGHPSGQAKAFIGQECVHHVYEVQAKANGSVLPYLDHANGRYECGTGDTDVLVINTSQVLKDEVIEGVVSASCFDDSEGCDTYMNGKLAVEINSVGGEYVKSSAASEDVLHLKERLQALERERAFMKEAIESLREENMELKLLQEIAQRLRELKGDVWRTEGVNEPGRHDQLPFLSLFKGILSFIGLQSTASTEKRRFFYACRESPDTSFSKEQSGLFHLLNNSLQEERSACVIRKRKVKLVNT